MFGTGTGLPQTLPSPTTLSFPLVPPTFSNTVTQQNCRGTYPSVLKLRASHSNPSFPLGSKITVRSWNFSLKFLLQKESHLLKDNDLGHSIGESSLQREFSNFGEIAEVKLVKDEAAKRSNAYAFIQYTNVDDAILALENLDHKIFGGRMIYVDLEKPGKHSFGGYPKGSGPPKRQRLHGQNDLADCWY